uniref:Uncharacterized protein n=1 Tax=Magallana gigas TaxID=29159 RepID=K1RK35_MAGGI
MQKRRQAQQEKAHWVVSGYCLAEHCDESGDLFSSVPHQGKMYRAKRTDNTSIRVLVELKKNNSHKLTSMLTTVSPNYTLVWPNHTY